MQHPVPTGTYRFRGHPGCRRLRCRNPNANASCSERVALKKLAPEQDLAKDSNPDARGLIQIWLVSDRTAAAKNKTSRHVDVADDAIAERLNALANRRIAAQLHPMLDDPVVLLGRFDHLAALPNVMRAGFFDVDIFARLARPNRR